MAICLDKAFTATYGADGFVHLSRRHARGVLMPTSQLHAAHQLRLYLSPESHSRLLRRQADAVDAGYRKPSFGELLDALVQLSDGVDLAVLMANVKSR